MQYDLSTSGVDTRLFPARTWARLQKELLYTSPGLLARGDPQGEMELRQALAGYLEEYRGVRCAPEQIIVGAGIEHLLSLLAPLLPGPAAGRGPGLPPGGGRCWKTAAGPAGSCRWMRAGFRWRRWRRRRGGLLRHPQPPVSHRRDHARPPPGPSCWAGPHGGRASATSSRTTTTRSSGSTPGPCPACRGWPGPTGRWSTCPRWPAAWPPASASPIWSCRPICCPPGGSGTASIRARWAALSSRPWPASSGRGILPRHLARSRVAYKARRTALAAALEDAFGPAASLSGLHTGLHLLLRLREKTSRPTRRWRRRPGRPASACRPSAVTTWTARRPAAGNAGAGVRALDDALCAPLAAALSDTLKKACTAASASLSSV